MEWYHLECSISKCIVLGTLDGHNITNIQARVWCLDDGRWAHSCKSSACKNDLEDFTITSAGKYFVGKEPTRASAIKAVMQNLKEGLL